MRLKLAAICASVLLASAPLGAYAIFAHQELIDLVWDRSIRPVLLQRYPGLTDRQLREARAYAYGGSIIQDMGYYPIGHRFFSDLTHYVRSGDFVAALFHTSKNADELAFAIGALSHYVGDSTGHPEAVNPATGSTFPDVARKYGADVTYAEAPIDHNRVEFGFDVAQIAQQHYTPQRYRKQVGFRVADAALSRALIETYGLTLQQTLGHVRPGAISYRICVHDLLPLFAQAQVVRLGGNVRRQNNNLANRTYVKAADHGQPKAPAGMYRRPGVKAHLLAGIMHVVPRIGPLRIVDIKAPTMATGDRFVRSMNQSEALFSMLLAQYASAPDRFHLENYDLDTGYPVAPGRYSLTDQTYARLLDIFADQQLIHPSAEMIRNVLAYYSDPNAPISTKRNPQAWSSVQKNLATLRSRYPAAVSH